MRLSDLIKPWIEQLKKIAQNRWVRLCVQLLILTLCTIYLVDNLKSINSQGYEIHINILLLIISTALTVLAVFLGALGFTLVLKAFAVPLKWVDALNIHLQSNLAKYIPGYAWQLVGKAYLTNSAGVAPGLVGLSMTIELIQLVFSGLVLLILTLPASIISRWHMAGSIVILLPFLRVFAIALFIALPFGWSWILRKTIQSNRINHLNPLILLSASVCELVGWLIFGYSFWLLSSSIVLVGASQLLFFVFTLTASILIGLAVIIVPASIGVREAVIVWFIGPLVGAAPAVIIAALARITVTLSELISAYGFRLVRRRVNNPKVLVREIKSEGAGFIEANHDQNIRPK